MYRLILWFKLFGENMDWPLQQGGIETEKENGNKHFQTNVRGRAEIEKGTEFVQHGGTRQNASW